MNRRTVVVNGPKITELRQRKGLTQAMLARKAGCSKRTIEGLENGSSSGALPRIVGEIAAALHVQIGELLLGSDVSPDDDDKVLIDVVLYEPFFQSTEEIQNRAMRRIAELVSDAKLVRLRRGSIVFTLEMQSQSANHLLDAIAEGAFDDIATCTGKLIESDTASTNSPLIDDLAELVTSIRQCHPGMYSRLVAPGILKLFPTAERVTVAIKGEPTDVATRTAVRRTTHVFSEGISDPVPMNPEDSLLLKEEPEFEQKAAGELRSAMRIPIISNDKQLLGAIIVVSLSQGMQFTESDLHIMSIVSDTVAEALQNDQLLLHTVQGRETEWALELAQRVQHCMFPQHLPKIPGYEFFATSVPAHRLNGDFYDFVPMADGRLAITVGDVTGRELAAALSMAGIQSAARLALMQPEADPRSVMIALDNLVSQSAAEAQFITMLLIILDATDNSVAVLNAGHMSPVIRRANGDLVRVVNEADLGLPLGIGFSKTYSPAVPSRYSLQRGDILIAWTDGIPEAMNQEHMLYGRDRLLALIASHTLTPSRLGNAICDDVRQFQAGRNQHDDMTLVIVGRVDSPNDDPGLIGNSV